MYRRACFSREGGIQGKMSGRWASKTSEGPLYGAFGAYPSLARLLSGLFRHQRFKPARISPERPQAPVQGWPQMANHAYDSLIRPRHMKRRGRGATESQRNSSETPRLRDLRVSIPARHHSPRAWPAPGVEQSDRVGRLFMPTRNQIVDHTDSAGEA